MEMQRIEDNPRSGQNGIYPSSSALVRFRELCDIGPDIPGHAQNVPATAS